jgi:hypothetical protein
MNEKIQPIAAVLALDRTTNEKMLDFIDNGLFCDDLAAHGISLVISTRELLDKDKIIAPTVDLSGNVVLKEASLNGSSIDALNVRTSMRIKYPGYESIPKLNSNKLKASMSKYSLYQKVLHDYQVPTYFLSSEGNHDNEFIGIINNISTENVVIKNDMGCGGSSTKILSKSEAITWLEAQIKAAPGISYIVQPQISFGCLPKELKAVGTQYDKDLLDRARNENLLTELRMFIVKCGEKLDIVPLLRIMPDKTVSMTHSSVSIDIELPDSLHQTLYDISKDTTNRILDMVGVSSHAVGAIDFYFDCYGEPRIMEANFRSPELPLTREKPIAGRAVHRAVAATLADMIKSSKES